MPYRLNLPKILRAPKLGGFPICHFLDGVLLFRKDIFKYVFMYIRIF